MKLLLPLTLTAVLLLCGCTDSKIPKVPPNVPAPKAAALVESPFGVAFTDLIAFQRMAI